MSEVAGPMHVAIFGASGATGRLLSERALASGRRVTALVRNRAAYPFAGRVEVVEGSVFDPEAVARTLRGTDAVLSALGANSLGKEDVLERAVPVIVRAMEQFGPRRIVVLGSAGALPSSLDHQPAWRRWVVEKIVYRTFLRWPVASQIAQWKTLSESALDWTMVMPPMLTNRAGRGTFRIDGGALPRGGAQIARADVADFMIAQLRDTRWVRKGVYVTW